MTRHFPAPGVAGWAGECCARIIGKPHGPCATLSSVSLAALVPRSVSVSNDSNPLHLSLHPSQQEITLPWVTYPRPLRSAAWILTDVFLKCCYCKTRSGIVLPDEKETTTEMQSQRIPTIKPKILINIYGFKTNHTPLKPKILIDICGSKTNPKA